MRSRFAALGVLVALTYSAHGAAEAPASAGKAPPSSPPAEAAAPATTGMTEADARAAELYRQGAVAMKAGRHEEAYRAFRQAWDQKPHFQIAANLGVVELQLGKHCAAIEHLTYFLRKATGVGQEELQQAEQMIAEARGRVGALKIEVERGAKVFVDRWHVGTAPLGKELLVEPGRRVIEVHRPGFEPAQVVVEANAAKTLAVRIALKPLAQPKKAEVRGSGGRRGG